MKNNSVSAELEMKAVEALKAVLGQVSVIKLREVHRGVSRRGGTVEILVDADVFGHSHTLACKVKPAQNAAQVRTTLRDFHRNAAQRGGEATPVLIAPYLSPESQDLCKKARASFLDLEGNARLQVGEVFIGKRSLPCRRANQHAAPAPDMSATFVRPVELKQFPVHHPPFALTA